MSAGWDDRSPAPDGVRWVESDGHLLAYRVVEVDPSSPITVLLMSGAFVPIEAMWADRGHARFVDGLAAPGRLVVYDRRGVGASDPVIDWDEPILRQWTRDAAAVIEAAGHGPVHVVGWEVGGVQALALASSRPDLVRSVTTIHALSRPERLEDIFGAPLGDVGEMMASWLLESTDLRINDEVRPIDLYYRSRAGDPAFARWHDEAGRRGVSPTTAARMWRSYCTPGLDIPLDAITAPVLSIRRADVELLPREFTEEIAELVRDGHHVEIPGGDLAPFCGDVDALVAEVVAFVGGERGRNLAGDQRLGAVLFTDVVGSTEMARRLGDERWRGVIDEYLATSARIFDRRRARFVRPTGDGSLAVFDLASHAAHAALELRAATQRLGLPIRQGIHVGELTEVRGEISGLALHVAARVMAEGEADDVLTTATMPLMLDDQVVFERRGAVVLRGLEGAWELYSLCER